MLTIIGVALLFTTSVHAQVLSYEDAVVTQLPTNAAATITSDGKFVYVAKGLDDAIEVYARNAATGALTLFETFQNNTNGISSLIYAQALALNPAQTRLYVVNQGSLKLDGTKHSDTLIVFKRDLATGALTFVEAHANNTNGVSGIAVPASVTVSPDGAHVYVAGTDDNAVSLFARSSSGDGLTFVESYKNGVGNIDALQKPMSIAVSPDGTQLYIAASQSNALVTFARDALTGKLQWKQALSDGVNGVDGLDGAQAVVASADGKFIYVAGVGDDAIAVLARDVQTGTLSAAAPVKNGVDGVSGLTSVFALAMSADDFKLYAVSPVDSALTVFQRNPFTGALTLLESHIDNIKGVDGLEGALALAASSDGAHVYTLNTEHKLGVFSARAADLAVRADTPSAAVAINHRLHYDFTVTNNGTDQVTGVMLSAQYPATLNVTVTSPSQGTCVPGATGLTCSIGTLPSGGMATVGVDAVPAQAQLALVDVAAYSNAHDPNTTNNTLHLQATVLDNNSAPIARNDVAITLVNALTRSKDESVSIDVLKNDTDADSGDTLVVQSWDALSPHKGVVEKLPDGTLRYTPATGYTGPDSFSYTIADIQGATATAQVTVIVNTVPVATGDEVSTPVDSAITIWVTANDTDVNVCEAAGVTYVDSDILKCDVLGVTAVDPTSVPGGAVEINRGSQYVTYTPAPGFAGVDSFTYTVTDDKGASSSAQVTVVVGGGVTTSGNGPGLDVNPAKKKGGGSIELWSLLCLAGCIACARSRRRRVA